MSAMEGEGTAPQDREGTARQDGEGTARQDGEALMLQIYPRPSGDTAPCCSLQVGPGDTAASVARSAGTTLGLDVTRAYALLEVREHGGEERPLESGDLPLGRVRLWPPEARAPHPRAQGYYFLLENPDAADHDGDDLCDLPVLSEDSILAALRRRFLRHDIYTYASGILIAINPYRFLPIYNPKYVKMYENRAPAALRPHVFAVADVAYRAMLRGQVSQCVVISGESGSGKTQSTNFLIHCLTALSQKGCSGALQRTILGAGPVLEAFGNAKTAQNNNSSRFGKFIQVTYLESGVVRGAVVEKYLLEKCRLVFRDKSERNYHVFYYLLVGASREERKEFHLLQPQDYLYLKQEDFPLEDEEDLRLEYKRLHQAMEMVGFLSSTKKQIFSVLSAILSLGNVTYTQREDSAVLEAGPADVLTTVSDLLKVKKEMLVEALTKRRQTTANVTLVLHYTLSEATTARDSMAKSLYSALFDWMVLHINHALLNRRDMEEATSCLSIGILDIFGFEDFKTNSFEQFCINYANERLHYYCNQHIFRLEQEEYQAEGITWHNIHYSDNMDCIQLISKKPTGLFHLLDEESNLPQATDGTLLEKLKQQHQDHALFVPTAVMEPAFVLQHYAGRVKYQVKDFREKNTDHMRPDIISLLRGSERAFLRQLVGSSPVALFRWGILRATVRIISVFKDIGRRRAAEALARRDSRKSLREMRRRSGALNRMSSNSLTLDFSFDRSDEHPLDVFEDIFTNYEKRKKNRGSRQKQLIPKNLMDSRSLKHIVGLTLHDRTTTSVLHPHQRKKPPSISAQFQASLNKLMETIENAEPFFIRCIRSNAEKRELVFDEELVMQQIRYTGLLETVRIRKSGYSCKYRFEEFFERFRMLMPKGAAATPGEITALLEKMGLDPTAYQIGKTKVFLKDKDLQHLQDVLNQEVMRHIIVLQRWFRSCLVRIHFLDKKDAATIIQRGWREYYDDNRSRAATMIQTAWRTSLRRAEYLSEQGGGGPVKHPARRQSVERRGLTRQRVVDHSPGRSEPVNGGDPASGQPGEHRGSPPPLNRPLSLPLDPEAGRAEDPAPHYSSLQRYTHAEDMQDKAARWKERLSEGEPTDESTSPETRPRSQPAQRLQRRGKSLSVDELAKHSSSGSDSSPSTAQFQTEADASRYSLPMPRGSPGSSPGSGQTQPTTPERLGFLSKILRKRPARDSQIIESPTEKGATLRSFSPPPYRMPSQSSARHRRNPTIRISRATRAELWNASLDREITDTKELRHLDEFLGNQVNELRTRITELSATEGIFLTATMQFRDTIKSMYSVPKPRIGYNDLMKGYQNKVTSMAGSKQKMEVQLVVNLFQSVLDGFIRGEVKREEARGGEQTLSAKKIKKRRKKDKCPDSPLGHMFSTYQVNIMQSCDLCGSYIWGMEKAYMCSACKLVCHKKCLTKIITDCSTRCARKDDSVPGSLHFGVQVCVLTSKANPVPKVVEMMLLHVEMNGLYTEGIYRKSGSTCRARELHQILETDPDEASLENYPIHTITGLVKRWLRELPDPLMTFTLYNDFLHAVELPETSERLRAIYQKLDELPSANFNTLERLIFHLVRVAKEEEHNRMSANSLAIVFAPCVLRTPHGDDPFLGMKDVSKTTMCLEILIKEQCRRYTEKLQNIQELEFAEALALNQLRLRRQNTVVEKPSQLAVPGHADSDSEAEKSLLERIKSIKEEKEELACRLPELEQENSDNDNLDSESSMSSESLLEERLGNFDSEGKVTMRSRAQRPDLGGVPGQADGQDAWTPPDVPRSLSAIPDEDGPSSPPADRMPLTASASYDDLDIPFIDEDV